MTQSVAPHRAFIGIAAFGALVWACQPREAQLAHGGAAQGSNAQTAVTANQPSATSKFFEVNIRPSRRHEGRQLGNVFAIRANGEPPDHAVELSPSIDIRGGAPVFSKDRASLEHSGDREILIVEQVTSDGLLSLRTTVTLSPDRPLLDIDMRLQNAGRVAFRDVRLGLRADWPGRPTFVPGLGFVRNPGTGQASWVGRESTRFTYGLAFPEKPEALNFISDHVGHVGVIAWSASGALDLGQSISVHRVAVALAGELADIAPTMWTLLAVASGTVEGKLDPAPKWATIDALDALGNLVLRARASADGTWRLPLPLGTYTLRLRSPGGMDEVPVTLADASKEIRIDFLQPMAGQLRFSAEDGNHKPLPTRWTFHGIGGTRDPELGPEPTGDPNVVFSGNGEGSVDLPEGAYRVVVTRGPEYSVSSQNIAVRRNQGAVVRAQLERRQDTSGWIGCDFHLHAAPSWDSEVPLEQRVMSLLTEGVEFAAATDHNDVTDYAPAVDALGSKGALATTIGDEITTSEWGHFNAFPLPIADGPPSWRETPSSIFAAIRQHTPDAIIQVNHPRMGDIGYFNRGELDVAGGHAREGFSFDFDSIEVFNGFDLGNAPAVTLNLESWFELLNAGHHYAGVGNSDSHRMSVQWAGYPRTYVRVPNDDPAVVTVSDIVKGLKAGAVMVSNGPFVRVVIDGHGPGETVTIKNHRARIDVKIDTARWITVDRIGVIVDGHEAVSQGLVLPQNGQRIQVSIPLELADDAWVVVIVRGDTPLDLVLPRKDALPLAFTNPIYVDANGDGRFQPKPVVPGP